MIIEALKKSIGIFKREQATEVNWPFIPEDSVECSMDDTSIDCENLQEPDSYVGVPAPEENVIDEWFADRTGEVITEDLTKFAGNYEGPLYAPYTAVDAFKQESTGDDGTHQKMYEMATKSWNTIDEYTGGSENFQEGPGGWNSGTGWGQMKK
tara:strand:- start:215 stop:673 length:459 start_codon:yes stop_codon:yes gene_type:complete